ncbi:MAG TPA: long-chain fatty acid--CoA ligase [Syntrophomonas sp.]|jgi:long-chain acyl-CoA synthetase|nr:long-chain fatty acid--CoA ligase [Syntrophomonas sp.]
MLVHELKDQGHRDDIALVFREQHITYGDVQDRVAMFRDYFYQQGIRPKQNVGLFCRNSPDFVYCYFALTSLGAVVVPININLAAPEIAYIVKDAGIIRMVTSQPLELGDEVTQLLIAEFGPGLAKADLPAAPDIDDIAEESECVIIYTSGTTGFPKGAVLTHRNLISNAEATNQILLVSKEDNMLSVLPMFHAFAWTVTILAPLLAGAKITIVEVFFPKDVIATIKRQSVSVVCGVPSMHNFYLALGTTEDFSSVRVFVSGGAPLPVEVLNQFQQKLGVALVEGYGLSEASPVCALNPLNRSKAGSIGPAIPGVELLIVDEKHNVLPAGEVGELIVQGPNVMKGYYNMPRATARAVVDGWLHTGDMAYIDEEGYVFIVDRLKDVVIVGGLNVYPREVEEVLYQYPGISEASVIGIPDKMRGEAICAFVAMKDGQTFDRRAILSFLNPRLANYKLPREVIALESIPKNSTGKISKNDLRTLYAERYQKA